MDSSTLIIIILVLVLLIAFGLVGLLAYLFFQKQGQLKRYSGLVDIEAEQNKVRKENDAVAKNIEQLKAQRTKFIQQEDEVKKSIAALKLQLKGLEDELDIQTYGLYEPKYDFGTSQRYKEEIDKIRQQQKQMIRDKEAIICGTEWTVQGSKAKGRKMMNEQIKLMLRAFNGECDSLILKVKYNNLDRIESRIRSVRDAVDKLSKTNNCWINEKYLDLKITELYLVHEYQEMLQAEKEEQRQIREQMREEEIARREIEKAQQDAEKEEQRYEQALFQARKEIEQATGDKQAKLQAEIEQLNQLLQEAHENKERAISRAQMTKSGHVYIISNIGSFGKDVYKIGMTRRLVPEDRVKELGDASVPFGFDVHALIYSEDAPGLENVLHKEFDNRRVNRINLRKEFFNVSLEEIKSVVNQNHEQIEFTMRAEAEEFRKTQAIIAKERSHQGERVLVS